MEKAFRDLMPHTIVVTALSARMSSGYPSPTYAATNTTYYARVVNKQVVVRDAMGQEKIASPVVYVDCTGTITPEYRVKLPDGTYPPILQVSAYPDEHGTHHTVLYFGK